MSRNSRGRLRVGQAIVLALGLLPLAGLAVGALLGRLGANPVETVTHVTGEWTLRLLLATLAVTPLRRLLQRPRLAAYRRTLGLLAFAYACLHFATYLSLDLALDFGALAEDIAERPYITVGFCGFVLLVPLAATSTRRAVRWLVAASCGVVHFLWLVKADLREPLIYAAVLAGLLGSRLASWLRRLRSPLVGRAARGLSVK